MNCDLSLKNQKIRLKMYAKMREWFVSSHLYRESKFDWGNPRRRGAIGMTYFALGKGDSMPLGLGFIGKKISIENGITIGTRQSL